MKEKELLELFKGRLKEETQRTMDALEGKKLELDFRPESRFRVLVDNLANEMIRLVKEQFPEVMSETDKS